MAATPSQLAAEVTRLSTTLLENNLAIDVNSTHVRATGGGNAVVTWVSSSPAALTTAINRGNPAEYLRLLVEREFTCVLFDGSLLQLSFGFARSELASHRLAYIPCPVALHPTDTLSAEATVYDLVHERLSEDFLRWQVDEPKEGTGAVDLEHLRLRPTLRFDLDLAGQGESHPGSHLHVFGEDSRWPAFGPLSVGHFVRFIFRHGYPSVWKQHAFLRDWPISFLARSVTVAEEAELYIECRSTA